MKFKKGNELDKKQLEQLKKLVEKFEESTKRSAYQPTEKNLDKFHVIEKEGKIVGYTFAPTGRIENIHVKEELRGKKLGAKVTAKAASEMLEKRPNMAIQALVDNPSSQKMFEKLTKENPELLVEIIGKVKEGQRWKKPTAEISLTEKAKKRRKK